MSPTSLEGLTIAITGSRRAHELAHLIERHGGTPYLAPTVGIAERPEITSETKAFLEAVVDRGVDYAVFMTGPGVFSLFSSAKALGRDSELRETLGRATVVARSAKPRNALQGHGVRTDLIPEENTAAGIADLLRRSEVTGKRIAVLWHGGYAPTLRQALTDAGAEVLEFSTYAYSADLRESGARILTDMGFNYVPPDTEKVLTLIQRLIEGRIDAITFTSPPSARNLFLAAEAHGLRDPLRGSLNERVIVVAVGPPTRRTVEEHGVSADVMPVVYKMGPMVKALDDYVRGGGPKRRGAAERRAEADSHG